MSTMNVKERPILFSGEMVRAILNGRKTQTRRVMKPQPSSPCVMAPDYMWIGDRPTCIWPTSYTLEDGTHPDHYATCPYGKPGDHLWVRETFLTGYKVDDYGRLVTKNKDGNEIPEETWYRADSDNFSWVIDEGWTTDKIPWKPSIHMPRRASRITLEIVSIRVERVQEISIEDVLAEGIEEVTDGPHANEYWREETGAKFAELWDEINKPRGFGWDVNPWVWVIEFKRTDK